MFEDDVIVTLLSHKRQVCELCEENASYIIWKVTPKTSGAWNKRRFVYICSLCGPKIRKRLASVFPDETKLSPDVIKLIVQYAI